MVTLDDKIGIRELISSPFSFDQHAISSRGFNP